MHQHHKEPVHTPEATKVPEVNLGFWIIEILATTLGETGGDAVTMSMNLDYLAGTAIFAAAVATQISAKRLSSVSVLDGDCRDYNRRNHAR